MTYSRGIATTIALAALGTMHPAVSEGGSKSNFCSKTARAASRACEAEALDDYWIATGGCNNTSDAAARETCLDAARDARDESLDECPDQRAARLDICDRLGQAPYDPPIDPVNFLSPAAIAANPNPFWPLIPGSVWRYVGGDETVTVTVTSDTKEILGVTAIVVHDVAEVAGIVVEDTDDYFAQDASGNVWYFGELSRNFENGELVDLDGSWKAGIELAKPGIVMPAAPAVDDVYRQEFFLGDAEDMAEVTSTSGSETVPGASCAGTCLVTHEFTPIEPDASEAKYYAPGIGLILEVDEETGDRVELIEYVPGP
jgi:hypothetical protein